NADVRVTGEYTLTVRDLASGETVLERDSPGGVAAFTPDGRFLLLGRGTALHLGGRANKFLPAVKGAGAPRLGEVAAGREVLRFPDEAVTAVAFAPDGSSVACGTADGRVLVWGLAPKPGEGEKLPGQLGAKELKGLWDDLAGEDAVAAYRAAWALRAASEKAVALLRQRLQPPAPDDPEVRKLIAGLDTDTFAAREEAAEGLRRYGAGAEAAVRQALRQANSPGLRQRLLALLGSAEMTGYPDALGRSRAVAVLEAVGTPGAREVLGVLADGPPLAAQTRGARAALERLGGRVVGGRTGRAGTPCGTKG